MSRAGFAVLRLLVALGVAALAGVVVPLLVLTPVADTLSPAWDISLIIYIDPAQLIALAGTVAIATWLGSELGIGFGMGTRGMVGVRMLAAYAAGSIILSLLYGAALFALNSSHMAVSWTDGEQLAVTVLLPGAVVALAAGYFLGRRAWPGAWADGLLALVVLGLDAVAVDVGFGLLSALLYQPCPRNEFCLDFGRWGPLTMSLPPIVEVGVWLGSIVFLVIVAAGLLRPGAMGRKNRRAGSASGLITISDDFI